MFIHSINGTQGYFKLYPSCLYQYRQQHKEHNSKQLAVLHFCNSYNCCPSFASWYQQQWQVLLSNTVHRLWLSSGYLQHDLSLIPVSAKQTFHNNINNLQSLLRVTGDTALEEKQREEWNLEGLRGKKKPRSKNCLCLSLADAESKTSVALWKAIESTGLVTMTVTMKEKTRLCWRNIKNTGDTTLSKLLFPEQISLNLAADLFSSIQLLVLTTTKVN